MATSTKEAYLFVYGTLMKRYANNPYTNKIGQFATYHSSAFTSGELYLIDFYPGLIITDSFDFVYGELFVVHDSIDLFTILDEYEDYHHLDEQNSLYIRRQIDVYEDVHTPPVKAWTYIYNRPIEAFRRIDSGNFLDL